MHSGVLKRFKKIVSQYSNGNVKGQASPYLFLFLKMSKPGNI